MAELGRRKFLGAVGAAGIGTIVTARAAGAETAGRGGGVVFVGSYTSSPPAGHGLDVASRSGAALRLERTVPSVPDASWFALSANRSVLYATNELVPDGAVTALSLRAPANPRVLNTQPSKGSAPTHLSVHPSGRYLLTANYGSGSVVVHPIRQDGSLAEVSDLAQHTGAERDAHAHQVVTDPSGRWVLAVDLGADSVYVYRLDLGTGKLTKHEQVVLPSGAGPRHLAFHPGGRVAYVLGELRAEVTVAAWDAARGKLTLGEVVPTVDANAPVPSYPGEIAVSPDGGFVYASNRGEDTIATFAVRDSGRAISRVGNVATGGVWPRHFTLDPSGRWIYVSNQRSGTVNWLPRDPKTGLPGRSQGSLAVPSVATVLFR
ncbi:lactonase family protein [Amycolatopsis nigrescens]|uniref:lactonase family protein n=1 Tax=Amycolatopsis nigrescens TaxID=381445 RepID=UPI000369F209|nr:lactonase family protein [Amycolatopsis nigrescens]